MPSNHLILCRPLLLLPPIPPSIRVFYNNSVLRIRWPKYWSYRFSISPANEYSELISFRMDWFDLLAVQGTLKILLQHQSSKASILQCSTFFMVQLSHPYMTTRKTIALTRRTFVSQVMSLLFNKLSRLVMEKAMATHSSTLAWRIPGTGAWRAAVCGVAQSRTQLMRLSSSSRLVIAFLPRSKHHLISWLQSPSAVILEPKKTV